jgi:peptide/nickel transport system permease protein
LSIAQPVPPINAIAEDPDDRPERSSRSEKITVLVRDPSAIIGGTVLLFWIFCAIFGEWLVPYTPTETGAPRHLPPGSEGHLLGTDQLGRDVFSRLIIGSRNVLIAAPICAGIGVGLGSVIGLIMGYYRGLADDILGRIVEAFLSLPVALVGLLALAALGPSTRTVIMVVGLLFAPIVARTVRAAVLAERENDYVQSAKLRGERGPYIMFREILPNITGPIIVEFTVRIGYAVFTIATLSFLGVGIQPPTPDWGLMVSDEYALIIGGKWWVTAFPAIAIASVVISVNLIADALQEVSER